MRPSPLPIDINLATRRNPPNGIMKKILLIDLDPATVADLHAALARQCEFWSVRDFVTAQEILDAVSIDCVVLGLRSDLPPKKQAQLPESLRRFFSPAPPRQSALVFSPRLIQDGEARGRLEAASEAVVSEAEARALVGVIVPHAPLTREETK